MPNGQVHLRHVAGNDHPRPGSEVRQEHLHLPRDRRVLTFIENDEGVAERAAADEGQRRQLDDA